MIVMIILFFFRRWVWRCTRDASRDNTLHRADHGGKRRRRKKNKKNKAKKKTKKRTSGVLSEQPRAHAARRKETSEADIKKDRRFENLAPVGLVPTCRGALVNELTDDMWTRNQRSGEGKGEAEGYKSRKTNATHARNPESTPDQGGNRERREA